MTTSAEHFKTLDTTSIAPQDVLVRNALDKIGEDGTRSPGMHHDALASAINAYLQGAEPRRSRIIAGTNTARNLMIRGMSGRSIFIFDLFLSINAVANISFTDEFGTAMFPTMYAPNTGQGFVFSSYRGFPLRRGRSLYITSSAVANYQCAASFAII